MSRVDVRALVVGSVATFVTVLVLFEGFQFVLDEFDLRPVGFEWLALIYPLLAMPGSIIAGYLHSTDGTAGSFYGVGAVLIGFCLPMVGLISLFQLPGPLIFLALIFSAPAMVLLAIGGAIGGRIGAELREWREG